MLKQGWNSGIAVLMVLGLSTATVAPILTFEQSAEAQLFRQNRTAQVPAGTSFSVEEQDGRKIVLRPNEKLSATLIATEAVRSSSGTVLIPRGSKIEGEFRPTDDGTQFFANRIILRDGTERRLDARSNIVSHRETIKKGRNTDAIWQGALVGGAAATVISALVTDVGIFKTLGGAGAGALAGFLLGGSKSADVIVIRPEDDPLTLTLDSELRLNS